MAQRRVRGLLDPDAPPGDSPFDWTTWVFASDGDMQEGIAAEAALARGNPTPRQPRRRLGRQPISIEDDTQVAFTEDVPRPLPRLRLARPGGRRRPRRRHRRRRTECRVDRGPDEREPALVHSPADRTSRGPRPMPRTPGRPMAPPWERRGRGHQAAARLRSRRSPSWSTTTCSQHARAVGERGAAAARRVARQLSTTWAAANPAAACCERRLRARELPDGWDDDLPTFEPGTRGDPVAPARRLSALADCLPELWGGSADLAGSNNTTMVGGSVRAARAIARPRCGRGNPFGRILHFGVREHAMGAIANGIALEGHTRPYVGTFLVFSDYMRPSVRLAALMGLRRSSSGPTTPSASAKTARRTSRSST